MNTDHIEGNWDVAIVGGGSAGLSAALTLARARRSVLVIDSGSPRNAPAAAVHGLLGLEGTSPLELLANGRAEAASYGAKIVDALVADVSGTLDAGFVLRLDNGTTQRAGQVLVATGVSDDLPAIPGLAVRWGRDVVHCPYCHGWEIRDQRIGLIATGPRSAMQAMLFHQWSDQLVFFTNDIEIPTEQLDKVRALNVTIVSGAVHGIDVTEDQLTGARLHDGTRVDLNALAVPTQTQARLDGLSDLALDTTENAMGVSLAVDEAGRTSAPGVWAAGNVMGAWMQVSEAAANGARVAMTMNTELALARADRAVATTSTTGGL